MKGLAIGIVAGAIAFVILVNVLPTSLVEFNGDNVELAILALAVGVVNSLIKPVVKLLSFPISLMTLGLWGFAVNAGLLLLVAFGASELAGIDFTVGGFPGGGLTADTVVGAVIASVALSLISTVVGLVVHD